MGVIYGRLFRMGLPLTGLNGHVCYINRVPWTIGYMGEWRKLYDIDDVLRTVGMYKSSGVIVSRLDVHDVMEHYLLHTLTRMDPVLVRVENSSRRGFYPY